MENSIKFSITIPAYKLAYLKQAITSVLTQTYTNFEVIIVDDCSPEDLLSIVRSFSDSRIRYYRNNKNCGAVNVVDNWNICLNYAHGEYVICMGDDDMLAPDALEQYVKLIEKYPNVLVFHSRVTQIDSSGQIIRTLGACDEFEDVLSFFKRRISGYDQYIGDFCYRRNELLEFGGYFKLPLAWGSDDITALRAAEIHGIAHTQTPTFYYRINELTISKTSALDLKFSAANIHEAWCKDFVKRLFYKLLSNDIEYNQLINDITDYFRKWKTNEILIEARKNKLGWIYVFKKGRLYNLDALWMAFSYEKRNIISILKLLIKYIIKR